MDEEISALRDKVRQYQAMLLLLRSELAGTRDDLEAAMTLIEHLRLAAESGQGKIDLKELFSLTGDSAWGGTCGDC